MSLPEALTLRSVTKTFGAKAAVQDLDLVIPQGALCGFIGPNGAGKTTAIRLILSILLPDRGEVSVLGKRSALEAKDRVGYLPEDRGLYRKMRVGAFLRYIARLKSAARAAHDSKILAWLERVGLAGVENKKCEELSKGMQQKVQFIAAILHEPDLLILDEPFSGLDPVSMRLLRDIVLEEHRRGATVLFSTHVMSQAEAICERVVMIHEGRKVLDGTLPEIKGRYAPRSLRFEPLEAAADPAPISSLDGVSEVVREGSTWEIWLASGADPSRVLRDAVATVPAARVEIRRPSLEDVFVEIVSRAGRISGDQVALLRAAVAPDASNQESRP
jgi:ABC-2 type transport system ATP-binding protein